MNRFFVDTNVLLDWLIPTNAFHTDASEFVRACFMGRFEGFVSSHSLTDVFYISRKYFSVEDRRQFLLLVISNFSVITEDSDDFRVVLNSEGFFDLEDGLQMNCAEKEDIDFIVTEDVKGFRSSSVQAISIADALKKISDHDI